MKALVISDIESKLYWDHYKPGILDDFDIIISCGDLDRAYLEFLVTMAKCPVVYVAGNHDKHYAEQPPEGCIDLEGRVYEYKDLRFIGFGGSLKYKRGPFMFTEKEMRSHLNHARLDILRHGGIDVLVTHSPAKGWGDLEDLPHNGYECFNNFLELTKPGLMLHGHIHLTYGSLDRSRSHSSGTKIINAYDKYIMEIGEEYRSSLEKKELVKNMIFGKI